MENVIEIREDEYRRLVKCECVVKLLTYLVEDDSDYLSSKELRKVLRVANEMKGE